METLLRIGASNYLTGGSRRTYDAGARLYLGFCDKLRIDHIKTPLSEEQLCKLCWLFAHGRKVLSLHSWLSAVEDLYRTEGWLRCSSFLLLSYAKLCVSFSARSLLSNGGGERNPQLSSVKERRGGEKWGGENRREGEKEKRRRGGKE